MAFLMLSCSSDDADNSHITVDIADGILGKWFVEWHCNGSMESWEFFNNNTCSVNVSDNTYYGTYSISGTKVSIRINYIYTFETQTYRITTLTPDRMELDNPEPWQLDYDFIRECGE